MKIIIEDGDVSTTGLEPGMYEFHLQTTQIDFDLETSLALGSLGSEYLVARDRRLTFEGFQGKRVDVPRQITFGYTASKDGITIDLGAAKLAEMFAHMNTKEQTTFFRAAWRHMGTYGEGTLEKPDEGKREMQFCMLSDNFKEDSDAMAFMEALDGFLWPMKDNDVSLAHVEEKVYGTALGAGDVICFHNGRGEIWNGDTVKVPSGYEDGYYQITDFIHDEMSLAQITPVEAFRAEKYRLEQLGFKAKLAMVTPEFIEDIQHHLHNYYVASVTYSFEGVRLMESECRPGHMFHVGQTTIAENGRIIIDDRIACDAGEGPLHEPDCAENPIHKVSEPFQADGNINFNRALTDDDEEETEGDEMMKFFRGK